MTRRLKSSDADDHRRIERLEMAMYGLVLSALTVLAHVVVALALYG